MRKTAIASMIVVAVLFLCLAWPSSPVRSWLLTSLAGSPAPSVRPRIAPPASAGPVTFRVAIGAMISPERTIGDYGRFFEAFARSAGLTAEIVQRRTYGEVNDLLARGEIDLAWLCTGAWVELNRKRLARVIAVPVVDGRSTYNALIIANEKVTAQAPLELRGVRFAYTDRISLTGCRYPQQLIRGAGLDPASFFSSTTFTHGHDRSIEAVRRGFADAASVDSLVYGYLERLSPDEVRGLRILHRSEAFPIPPLAVSPDIPESRFLQLQKALIAFSESVPGREALGPILVERFALPDEKSYQELD